MCLVFIVYYRNCAVVPGKIKRGHHRDVVDQNWLTGTPSSIWRYVEDYKKAVDYEWNSYIKFLVDFT